MKIVAGSKQRITGIYILLVKGFISKAEKYNRTHCTKNNFTFYENNNQLIINRPAKSGMSTDVW
jgi:hypothetical protein